jgi:hypothetical protein
LGDGCPGEAGTGAVVIDVRLIAAGSGLFATAPACAGAPVQLQ